MRVAGRRRRHVAVRSAHSGHLRVVDNVAGRDWATPVVVVSVLGAIIAAIVVVVVVVVDVGAFGGGIVVVRRVEWQLVQGSVCGEQCGLRGLRVVRPYVRARTHLGCKQVPGYISAANCFDRRK